LSIKVSVARFMIHTVQPAAAGLRSVRRSLVTAVAGVWGAAPLCSALGVGSSRLARGPGAANEAPSGFWMVNMGPASTTPAAGTQDTQDSQDTPKTHLRLSFPPLPTRRRSFLGVGAVIPSDRLQAESHQFQEKLVSSWPIQPRSGQVWRCGLFFQPQSRRGSQWPAGGARGSAPWKRDGLEVGGVFFLDCVAASSMVQAEAGRQSRQSGDMAA
jgi:hypothetical protein